MSRACAFENKQTSDIEIPMLFITTQSRLLTKEGKDSLENSLRIPVKILPLQQMNTEKQFRDKVKEFLAASFKNAKLDKDFKSTSDK